MSKRTRVHTDTNADASEFLEAPDGSYCEALEPRSKKARQTRKVAPKRARASATATTVAVVAQESPGVALPSKSNATHPTSWHFVTGVDPIRESLLDWYARTHEVRGMPWRKPFDGSLDKDGRAQRAYEVRSRGQHLILPGPLMSPY
jgi:A/G-specific adenine glycosylase